LQALGEEPQEARAAERVDSGGGAKPKQESKERIGTVWLKEGEYVRPVEVRLGASDGANTSVVSDNLQEGQEIVTGETTETAMAGTQNPFLPQFRRR
jgi:hypothetical protein